MEGNRICTAALKEVEKELQGGRPEVEEIVDPAGDAPTEPVMEFSGDEEEEDLTLLESKRVSVLDDVPAQCHRDKRANTAAPAPGAPLQKKVRFEEARAQTAKHLAKMKETLEKYEPNYQKGGSSSSAGPAPGPPQAVASHRGHGVLFAKCLWDLDNAARGQRALLQEARRGGWSSFAMDVLDITEDLEKEILEASHQPPEDILEPVTGKPRLEFRWKDLEDDWKSAFIEPLKKAVDVYVDHDALEPVPLGLPIPPEKILPSRFVLTNKGKDLLEDAILKARWVLAGHLDKEAGKHATEAPTASLVAHNLICFISAQMGWKMRYADISAAFLQGENLDKDRVVYIRMPKGYPDEISEHLIARLSERGRGSIRRDLVRLIKGGFGLAESPRLWYLRLKRGLEELGLRELKLSPGTFVYHHGSCFKGILAFHVDDLRMAFHPDSEHVLVELRAKFHFGEWKEAVSETVKFCGRWEKQDPVTFQVTVSMDGYVTKLKDPPVRKGEDRSPLTDAERKWVSSVGGQLNWMARQGRADLAFGISKIQQMSGARDPDTLKALHQLVKKAREPYDFVFQRLPGGIEDLAFVAVSDASHGSMPKGRSQGGMMILLANEEITEQETLVNCVLYHSAVLKRVVRSSLAAEVSQAAEAMEQCDYVRAMFAELYDAAFSLPAWRWSASRWKEILVLDSKTGYDVLNSIGNGEDKRLAIDIAILKESIYEEASNKWIRWVPGMTMPADGLTKEYGNEMRDIVMRGGPWSLKENPAAQRLREEAGFRKRQCKDRRKVVEQALEDRRQALQVGQM